MNLLQTGAAAARALVDIVFPERCVLCGRDLPPGRPRNGPVCAGCLGRLPLLAGDRCRVCGLPLVSEIERCTRCRVRDFAFDAHRSLFEYSGDARELVYHFKFKGRAGLASFFAPLLAAEAGRDGSPDFIVPAPSSPSRTRRRGFAHVRLLAVRLSRLGGWPVADCLTRAPGEAQKTLDFSRRQSNLRGKIRCADTLTARLRGRSVLLLDDIFTTGATAQACAAALKEGGANAVRVLTLAMEF